MREIVHGDRLDLRRIRKRDKLDILDGVSDRDIARYTFIPHPYSLSDAEAFVRSCHADWRKGTAFRYGLISRETRSLIGCIGIETVSRKHLWTEIGYWLRKDHWGRGLMKEAVSLCLELCFIDLGLKRVQAHVMTPNEVSAHLLERLGFSREGTLRSRIRRDGDYLDLHIFSILREEWESRARATGIGSGG